MRDIFTNYFHPSQNKIARKVTDDDILEQINNVDDKAVFFDKWHVEFFPQVPQSYADFFASNENAHLFNKISEKCEIISESDFERTLSKINIADISIVATAIYSSEFLFRHRSKILGKHRNRKPLSIQGLSFWYPFKDKAIPVFLVPHPKVEEILILNRKKVGKLIRLSPLVKGEEKKDIEDTFYMRIQAYSDDEKLMNDILKKKLDWLVEKGEEKEQREYLRERVNIRIKEYLDYQPAKGFAGYKIILKKEDIQN